MTLLYASTFTAALTKLSQAEAGAAIQTALRIGDDPRGNGLQMHRIDKADGFWSVRVNRDVRIILHRDGERVMLAYVDHHDAAYAWAERKRLVAHERTGAMQFVEVPVVAGEPLIAPMPTAEPMVARPFAAHHPFAKLSDDQLLDVGVPRDWLQPVRDTPEADVEALFERLPAEAAEALLDVATGGRIEDHVAVQAIGADPYAHPDAQRRFRAVEGLEELKAALDAPFERWAVFLHPAQRGAVERDWNGPARISGSAGTGKTIVALHRAVRLARDADARVLLTTFSKPLAAALADKVALLTETAPDARARITVRAIDQAAYDLYSRAFGQPNLANANQVRAAIKAAVDAGLGAGHTPEFLLEEWDEVVDAWGLHEQEAYAEVPRMGRKIRLGAKQRENAWEVFAFVRERLAQRGLVSWADLYGRLTAWIEKGGVLPFTHVVVDEAQDLSVAQAKFLAATGQVRADALFFTGDLGQRIFHLPFSWARLGLDIRGRSQVLKVCYRTSHQIRSMADRLLAPEIVDQDGITETRRGTVSVFDGPEPVVRLFETEDVERDDVAVWLADCLAAGLAPSEIAVLVRGIGQIDRARAVIAAVDASISVVPMHDAKGLEFAAVALMALDEDVLPDPERLEGLGDIADIEAVHETERHLLYVAATRARDRLMLSGVAPGSEFIDDFEI